MAELVRQPTVALEQRYDVKVFSLRNWDALLAWLDDLEAGMTKEHRSAVGMSMRKSGQLGSSRHAPPPSSTRRCWKISVELHAVQSE